MPLYPTFSVTPLKPVSSLYDSVKGEYKHYAYLGCIGVYFYHWASHRLTDQYSQDKAVLCYSPIATPAPTTFPSGWTRYSVAHLGFKTNATTEDQYLLIYHVAGYGRAAFYINGNLVRSERIVGDEYMSILVDCPPSQTWWHTYMFLEGYGTLELKGIECYVQ